jgi:hypothetical protein
MAGPEEVECTGRDAADALALGFGDKERDAVMVIHPQVNQVKV